jgi:hypothetical protein
MKMRLYFAIEILKASFKKGLKNLDNHPDNHKTFNILITLYFVKF